MKNSGLGDRESDEPVYQKMQERRGEPEFREKGIG
jgi:hypothetical protein